MADNTVLSAGAGGDTIATDDIGGVKHQRCKNTWGPDGTATDVDTGASALPVQDGGNSLTVDGTVTVGAVPAPLSTTGGGTEATALRVTVASDSTGVLSVDDNGGSLTVDGSVTANAGTNLNTSALALEAGGNLATIASAVQTEDAASSSGQKGMGALVIQKAAPADTAADGDYSFPQMSAGRVWVSATVDAALPAGANAIGKLAANSGVDIGDVDVTTVGTITPGTAATSLGKAEDGAHTSGDVGVMALTVRQNTPAALAGTDADYQPPITDGNGLLWVAGGASAKGGWSVATGSIAATKTDIGSANTAGQVGGWYIYNANASVAYVQFFNAQASAVTLGTTAPVYSLGVPATSAANVAPGMVGINHATAISIAVTTTRAGSTGPGSTVDYNIWYKQ